MTFTPKAPREEWLHSFLQPHQIQAKPYSIDTPKVKYKMDQNESPYDWPQDIKKRVLDRLAQTSWNRYPHAFSQELEALLAKFAGLSPGSVLTTPGSNYLICSVISTLTRKTPAKIVIAQPSFPLYEQHCRYEGLAYETWNLDENLQYDLKKLPQMPPRSILIFASPNNPVGNVLPYEDLQRILHDNPDSLVIADEAYYEFSDSVYTDLLKDHANLLSLRTFSKTMAGAGVRLGYALGHPSLIEQLRKPILPYMLNHFTLIAATEALQSETMLRDVKQKIRDIAAAREQLHRKLQTFAERDGFSIVPSHANFLLIRWPNQAKCQEAYQGLIDRGVLPRNVSGGPGLTGCLRLTVGSTEENAAAVDAFAALAAH